MNKIQKIDIRPKTSIYNTFARYTYKQETAIAELLDNSTQSFIDNDYRNKNIIPQIYIIYKSNKDEEELIVADNAFGINNENLERVLKLNDKPKNTNGRNEFGMGLKTASFWFGKRLEIFTKNINESHSVHLVLDLDELDKNEDNLITPIYAEGSKILENYSIFSYGTTIKISKLQNKISTKIFKKLVNVFASKYRNDINHGLEIRIIKWDEDKKGEKHIYDVNRSFCEIWELEEALPLEFKHPKFKKDNNGKEIKNIINKEFEFENKRYKVSGIIGLLDKGNREGAGLVLMRRGRTIIGDDASTYRPKEIFGGSGTFSYQRIYGTLVVDDFPVVYSKDAFDWNNGLEDAFIEFLSNEIENGEYKLKKLAAELKYNEKDEVYKTSELLTDSVAKSIKDDLLKNNSFSEIQINLSNDKKSFMSKIYDKVGNEYIFNIFLELPIERKGQWLHIENKSKSNLYNSKIFEEYNLYLNFKHKFFSPFNNEEEIIKRQIIKFSLFFAYAEIKHKKVCTTYSHELREQINDLFLNEEIEIKENEK